MVVARLVAGRRQDLLAMHNLHFQQDISVVPSCTYKPQAVKSKSATRSANEHSWAVEVTAKDIALFSKRSPRIERGLGKGMTIVKDERRLEVTPSTHVLFTRVQCDKDGIHRPRDLRSRLVGWVSRNCDMTRFPSTLPPL